MPITSKNEQMRVCTDLSDEYELDEEEKMKKEEMLVKRINDRLSIIRKKDHKELDEYLKQRDYEHYVEARRWAN